MKNLGIVVIIAMLTLSGMSVSEAAARAGMAKNSRSGQTKTESRGRSGNTFTATLTTYWAQGSGSDYWTRKHTSSTGQALVSGVSVAADPRVVPYGSLIDIKGVGRRVVKDTGSHVVKRVASLRRGVNYPVIDIFFERKEDALRFARNNPAFAEVKVVRIGG